MRKIVLLLIFTAAVVPVCFAEPCNTDEVDATFAGDTLDIQQVDSMFKGMMDVKKVDSEFGYNAWW